MTQTCCVMPSNAKRLPEMYLFGVLTVLRRCFFVLAEDKEMVHVFGLSLCSIRKLVLTCLASLSVWGVLRSLDCCLLCVVTLTLLFTDKFIRHVRITIIDANMLTVTQNLLNVAYKRAIFKITTQKILSNIFCPMLLVCFVSMYSCSLLSDFHQDPWLESQY